MSDKLHTPSPLCARLIAGTPAPHRRRVLSNGCARICSPHLANGLLTIVSLYVIYLLVSSTLPWMFNGFWNTAEPG